jgi:hypothetical protein
VTLAPGFTAVAYVPTAAERAGDFNPFAGLLLDPLANNTPFPGGIIPASRLPSPMAWRIASNLTPSNDSTRLSDMSTLQSAIALTQSGSKPASMGSAKTVYVSIPDPQATTASGSNCASLSLPVLPAGYTYHCSGPSYYQKTDGTGWIPINFSSVTSGSPLGTLPIDPINTVSSRLYYTYTTNGSQYETTAVMESSEYKLGGTNDVISQDGGTLAGVYEKGTKLGLEPLDYGDASLVGYWTFDEGTGTVAYDYSGNNATGSWGGSDIHWTMGRIGSYAGQFAGTAGDYVRAAPIPSLNGSGKTVSAWVYHRDGNQERVVGVFEGVGSAVPQYALFINNSSALRVQLVNSGGTFFGDIYSSYSLSVNAWHHIAVTYDGSHVIFHLDGVAESHSLTGIIRTDVSPALYIGARGDLYSAEDFNGLIDDVRIYNRALSTAEIQAMYRGGK